MADLPEKLEQLMPSIWIMVATLGSLCVLIIILTKFLYNPIKKMVKERQDFIQKNIDDSIKAKENAIEFEQKAKDNLDNSKQVAFEIISKSKIEAEILKHQYIDQGKLEAERLILEAKDEIANKKREIEEYYHDEIVQVAAQISEKMLEEKVNHDDIQKYLNRFLSKNDGK